MYISAFWTMDFSFCWLQNCLQVPENYTPPAPITAPIMAPLGEPQPIATMQPSLQPQQLPPQPAGVPAPFNPIQQQPQAPTLRNPAMPSMPLEGPPGAPTGDIIQVSKQLHALKCTFFSAFEFISCMCMYKHIYSCSLKYGLRACLSQVNVVLACSDSISNWSIKLQCELSLFFSAPSQCSPSLLRRSQRSPSQTSTSFSRQRSRAWSRSAWLLPQTLLVQSNLSSHRILAYV